MPEYSTSAAPAPGVEAISQLVAGKPIAGVELRGLKMNHDARGCFTEVFLECWDTCVKPVKWSIVHSNFNVFRGVHIHRQHDEFVSVIVGRASIGLRDLRPWSPTKNTWSLYELHGADLACICFPVGILHGLYFHEPGIHLQAVSAPYVDHDTVLNWGCHWSDPALEIPWPCTDPILTMRAADFPTLHALEAALGDWSPPQPRRHFPGPREPEIAGV